jgi:uncharacterized protein (TIGR03435 family)
MLVREILLLLAAVLAPSMAQAARCTAQTPGFADLPVFAAATIKPPDPSALAHKLGFYGEPGGRIFFGGTVKMLVGYAFNLPEYRIAGGPDRILSQSFEINAVPPETSPSRNIKVRNAEPTAEQRLMLQSLIRERFGFEFHLETRDGDVYMLTRGSKTLQLMPPKNPASDPRAILIVKAGGTVDGEAIGINTNTDYLALRLGRYLQLPMLNQTGVTGSYDFYLPPDDPENHDMVTAVYDVAERLGLKIKRGRGPVETLVIDHLEQPLPN